MKHPITPPEAKTLRELGRKIGLLRYDALAEVLVALADEMARQAKEDERKKRPKLCSLGSTLSVRLHFATAPVLDMFCLSEPYLKDEIVAHPLSETKRG